VSALKNIVEKIVGKTKRAIAEVIGDGKLSEEGRREEKLAERKAEEANKTNLSKIANNLT
jgi:hypothetical protein